MLEKIESKQDPRLLSWDRLRPDSVGEGICYVRDGNHRFTRADKPFIVLYLQDIKGSVIPGYIFDVENFKQAGTELTQVTRQFVKIFYTENYHPKFGMSICLNKVELITDPTTEMFNTFLGSVKEAKKKYESLCTALSEALHMKINIPSSMCTLSHMNYSSGAIGGLAIHYWDLFQLLKVYAEKMTVEERTQLWGTFLIYLYVHGNYVCAEARNEADVSLIVQLTASIDKYIKTLKLGKGAVEVVHIFFGYQPKDIYVRLICQTSEQLIRANKEYNLFRTLPFTREGDAGYGTIKNYNEG